MRWGVLLATAWALGAMQTANAQSVADTLGEFGLIGTWATDCAQPASASNYLTVYAIMPSGEVSRTYYDAPDHVYNNYKIVSAERRGSDLLAYEQVWDFEGKPANMAGDRVKVLVNVTGGRFQVVSSQGSDGEYFVKDRKFPSSGDESPWQSKCQGK